MSKSMNPDRMHPQVLRELVDIIVRPLLVIFDRSLREVPKDWRKANVTPILRKGKKDNPGNCRPSSFTLIPGKVMEQLIQKYIFRHTSLILNIFNNSWWSRV